MINLGNCTLTLDGIEVTVTNVEVTYEGRDVARATVDGIITGFEAKKEINIMDSKCDEAEERNLSTVSEYRRLSLTPEDKLLKKHGILNEYGGLSYDGRDFVLEVWFNENKDKVVEALKAIEEARKAEKK